MSYFSSMDYEELNGTPRITNPKTLENWKQTGRYQELIDKGFIYASGCGRFRLEVCTCFKCRREIKENTFSNTKRQNKLLNGMR